MHLRSGKECDLPVQCNVIKCQMCVCLYVCRFFFCWVWYADSIVSEQTSEREHVQKQKTIENTLQ